MEKLRDEFVNAMDKDFNTPQALAALFNMSKEINKFNFAIPQIYTVIEEYVPGVLIEVTLRSTVNTFSCSYRRDGEQRYYTYDELTELQASPVIAAHQESDTNVYLVQFRNLRWDQNFLFQVHPSGTTTFNNLRALWEIETIRGR